MKVEEPMPCSKKSRFATHTDEELDELLKDLPYFDSVDHADLSKVDYSNALKALEINKIKTIKRWL